MFGRRLLALCALGTVAIVANAQLRQEMTLTDNWQFSRDKQQWQTVSVPHDWAISGPFDKKWDLQKVAIVQNGETTPTEKKTVTPSKDKYSYIITNSHETEKTKVSVEKVWDDSNNQDGKRPESITVQFKKDGADYGDPVTLDAENSWKHELTGLDKYRDNGTLIEYSVDEVEVPTGYTKTVTPGKDKYSYTITNSHETEKVKVSVLKIWDDKDNQDGKRHVPY